MNGERAAGTGDEFPAGAQEWPEHQSRREFLLRTAASLALAGAAACRQPREHMVQAVGTGAGESVTEEQFATAVTRGGLASGVLVTTDGPRPRRLDGNPAHPTSRGGLGPIEQAAILGLYDPYCSRQVRHGGKTSEWRACAAAVAALRADAPVHVLTGRVTSPTIAAQIGALVQRRPGSRWHRHEPIHDDGARAGSMAAFGRFADVLLRPEQARVVLALDGDPLLDPPGAWAQARAFARARQPGPEQARWYAVESTPTPLGVKADHRLALGRGATAAFARELARALGVRTAGAELPERARAWIAPLVRDLQRQRSRGIVVAGRGQPAEVHALVHRVNHALGNLGSTVLLIEPVEQDPVLHGPSLGELATAMANGEVQALLVFGTNPVWSAPADLDFATALQRVPFRVHLGREYDETAAACTWHVPMAHELEAWGDCRAHDGTVTIQQPLIEPLASGRTPCQLLALLSGEGQVTARQPVLSHWRQRGLGADFEAGWRTSLREGFVAGSASAVLPLQPEAVDGGHGNGSTAPVALELTFEPHPALWDGTFAGNPWLQELPDAVTSLTWDNAALFSPRTAERFGVGDGDEVELEVHGRRQLAPVLIVPGQADDCVIVQLGHGRRQPGPVGAACGFASYVLRDSTSPWSVNGLQVRRTGARRLLARAQPQQERQDHEPVRELPAVPADREPPPETRPSLYPERAPHSRYAWGMAIDLQSCIGCNACVIGCQAENNVPVVGREQVAMGRIMHWLRVDHYRLGPEGHGAFEPMACQHCENAPCETVCPVGATVHSVEGLNEMVYNRCIGTRYCSNNCAWKVRRFNFLAYGERATAGERVQRNRQVTVRSRGVMEKCTYCVQRIDRARIAAKQQGRAIREGEVVTACQAVCPTQAIVFGDLNDEHSAVAAAKRQPRDFLVLGHLNTRPRTSYGAVVCSRNPEIPS